MAACSMSRPLEALLAVGALLALAGPALAGDKPLYGYGTHPTQAQIDAWNIDVRGQDGLGLPAGKGSVDQGSEIFAEKCAACHGTFGEGVDRWPQLAGGEGTLKADRPEPTVGSYWPFAATLYDYIGRAMPFPNPRSLTPDEVYALTAYILNLNNLVPGDFVADKDSLPKVGMPNHDNFTWEDPRPDTRAEPCMSNCRDPKAVTITSTAEGKTLTPRTTGPLDDMQPK